MFDRVESAPLTLLALFQAIFRFTYFIENRLSYAFFLKDTLKLADTKISEQP